MHSKISRTSSKLDWHIRPAASWIPTVEIINNAIIQGMIANPLDHTSTLSFIEVILSVYLHSWPPTENRWFRVLWLLAECTENTFEHSDRHPYLLTDRFKWIDSFHQRLFGGLPHVVRYGPKTNREEFNEFIPRTHQAIAGFGLANRVDILNDRPNSQGSRKDVYSLLTSASYRYYRA